MPWSEPDATTRRAVALEIESHAWPVSRSARSPLLAASHPALHPITAIGMLTVSLHVAERLIRPTLEDVLVLTMADDGGEEAILHYFGQQMDRLGTPLILTYSGRRRVMPLLRYRAIALGVPLHFLRTVAGPSAYFHRFTTDWHLDLEDTLAANGAIAPVGLEELCHVSQIGLPGPGAWASEVPLLISRIVSIYALYLRYAGVHGLMLESVKGRALHELADADCLAKSAEQFPPLGMLLDSMRPPSDKQRSDRGSSAL